MNALQRLLNTGYVGARAALERRIPYWPATRIAQLQGRRVRSIVRHAYATVPYYRETMRRLDLSPADFRSVDDLTRLPLLDDLTVRRDPERFASSRYPPAARMVVHTSGTTSRVRKQIFWNDRALLDRMAFAERDRVVINALAGRGWGQRQLYIFPPDSMAIRLREFWDGATFQPPRGVERHVVPVDIPFEELRQTINRVRPQVVFSFGAHADQFFRWLVDSHLPLTAPRVWMYGAEALPPTGRAIMEQQFGCIVYSTYQAVETGRIGFECEHRHGFHVNIDSVAVRVLDDDGNTAAPGELGEVVVSNLYNRAMVLLNCRLGDMASWATGQCPCGRTLPVLEALAGRQTELLHLADGRTMREGVFCMAHKTELEDVIQCQVQECAPGDFVWRIVPASRVDPEGLRTRLLARTRSVLGPDARIAIEFVDAIPRDTSGKFRRLVRAEIAAPGGDRGAADS